MAGIYGAFLKEESLDSFNKFMSNNPVVDEYKVKEGLINRVKYFTHCMVDSRL